MGRPLSKKFFGPVVAGGTQLAATAWLDGDTQARPGYIVKQNGTDRYHVQTSFGEGECFLVETITEPGQMVIQLVAEGTPSVQSVRKLTDREVYSFTDSNYYVNWEPVNGQVVYGNVGPGPSWAASFGNVADATADYSQGLTFDGNGDIIVTGNQDWYQTFGPTIAYVMKMTAYGTILWQKGFTWNSNAGESAGQVVMCDSSNNIFVAITKFSGSQPWPNVLVKLDPNGTILWQRELQGFGNCKDMVVDSTGAVVISATDTPYLAKYDSSGNLVWQKDFNTSDGNVTVIAGCSLAVTTSNNIVLSFPYDLNSGGTKTGIGLISVDTSGNTVWEKSLVSNTVASGYWYSASDSDSSGNVFVQFAAYDQAGGAYWSGITAKYLPDGTLVWQKRTNNNSNNLQVPYATRSAANGTTYSVGYGYDNNIGLNGITMHKRDSDGNLIWQRILSQPDGDLGQDYFYGGGARDVSVYQDYTVWAGFGKAEIPQTYLHGIITHLPTDGTDTGTYGALTYANTTISDQTATFVTSTTNASVSTISLTEVAGDLSTTTLALGLKFTSFV